MTTEQQAKYWRYAAWTAPFAALAIIIGEILLGFDSIVNITSIAITTIFITTSVFWWWWAVSKIVQMMECSKRVEKNFLELSRELKEIRKDVGDRQWREPSND
jgi:hypothetical protein